MNNKLLAIVSAAVLVAGMAMPVGSVARAAGDDPVDTYELLDLFGNVFERVRADYVDDTTDQDLIEAAISGMLASLDPHSAYMNANRFQDMQVETQGEFGGLGIEVTMENGVVRVVSPIDDTPAYRAGLQPGDYITHLDGEPVLGLELGEAVDRMRGKVGTDLTVTVVRGDQEPFEVTLTRAVITIESVRSRLDGDVGYLRITSFSGQTSSGVERALAGFKEEKGDKLQGIVLDLRNNPGGLLNQAVEVSDAFLDKGEIVSTRSKLAEETERHNARSGDLADGVPVVVLINGGSASASEIVAGALQDHGRAIIMGTQSFGKGSVQTIIPLGKHGAMRLTTARYYTPSGTSIQAKGIEPDIVVEQARLETLESGFNQREADLRGALQNEEDDGSGVAVEPEAGAGDDTPAANASAQDYQLSRAIDLLRGIALYKGTVLTPEG
ncbi:MAG: S41 family peptidase [Rhodospirillales bacterium]